MLDGESGVLAHIHVHAHFDLFKKNANRMAFGGQRMHAKRRSVDKECTPEGVRWTKDEGWKTFGEQRMHAERRSVQDECTRKGARRKKIVRGRSFGGR